MANGNGKCTKTLVRRDPGSQQIVAALFPELTNPRQRAFLAAYCQTANLFRAAKIAKTDRNMHYRWLQSDNNGYAQAFERARWIAGETLEAEAVRRAHDGVDEPVFYRGEECGYVRRYSDVLLIFLLKGAMPDKYRERYEARLDVQVDAQLLAELTAGRARVAAGAKPSEGSLRLTEAR